MTTIDNAVLVKTMPKLYEFARTMARSKEQTDDLVQSTIVKALSHKHLFEANPNNVQSSINGWLYRIMRNLFLSEIRQQRRLVDSVSLDGENNLWQTESARLSRPAMQIRYLQTKDDIRLLKRLPKHIRITLLMSELEEMNQEEISWCTGVTVGTVKSRISRARKMLREQQEILNGRVADKG
jgi:RNA polymerase sigma-70 factor, ECF subfamily